MPADNNPFADLETSLEDPPCSGFFVALVNKDTEASRIGIKGGDVIVRLDGEEVHDKKTFLAAFQPRDGAKGRHELVVRALSGGPERRLQLPPGPVGLSGEVIHAGVPAWKAKADSEFEADLSTLRDGTELLMCNYFGEEAAGYERIRVTGKGDSLGLDVLFWLGGDEGDRPAWTYRVHVVSEHRIDRNLSTTAMRFEQGLPEKGLMGAQLRLIDGVWQGEEFSEDGTRKPVSCVPKTLRAINSYATTVLPQTLPLARGTCFSTCIMANMSGETILRQRFECMGQQELELEARPATATCFKLANYGKADWQLCDTTRYWVSDDRRLLRVDWGPDYGDCWAETVSPDCIQERLPKIVRWEP